MGIHSIALNQIIKKVRTSINYVAQNFVTFQPSSRQGCEEECITTIKESRCIKKFLIKKKKEN